MHTIAVGGDASMAMHFGGISVSACRAAPETGGSDSGRAWHKLRRASAE